MTEMNIRVTYQTDCSDTVRSHGRLCASRRLPLKDITTLATSSIWDDTCHSIMSSEWSYGLFGCFGDCRLCLMAFCCPCVQTGRNSEYFGENCMTATILNACFGCPYDIIVRNRLRHLRGIHGSMTTDLLALAFCYCCVIVQNAREIEEAKRAGLPTGDTTVTSTTVIHSSMARE